VRADSKGGLIEVQGNLWDWQGLAVLAVTTNGSINRRGECPMPRGCARQARERFPDLPAKLGELIRHGGNHVWEMADGLVSFPVEHHWLDRPDLSLIARSAAELAELARQRGWPKVVVPRPGCGGGGLSWDEVRPLLAPHFDDRFLVISP
jgi:hypothetical protein